MFFSGGMISGAAQAIEGMAEEAPQDRQEVIREPPEVSILERKHDLIERLYARLSTDQKDEKILQQLAQAKECRDNGKLLCADHLLNQTLQEVGKAARNRGGINRSLERSKIRYEEKLTQYASLWEAMHFILNEKGLNFASLGNQALIQQKFDKATVLAEQKRYLLANQQIDQAYRQLSLAVSKLRDKETLEYKLEFENPSDEYAYERRRYHTHELLLKMKLAEKADPTQLKMAVDRMTRAAEEHHAQAEDEAKRKEYESAIKTQEKAISLLIDALRQAGLYLPQ